MGACTSTELAAPPAVSSTNYGSCYHGPPMDKTLQQAPCTTTTATRKKKKMGHLQKCISLLNLATLLLSIPIVGSGLWLSTRAHTHSSDCARFLRSPILSIGSLMLLLSLLGFMGACCSLRRLLWLYLLLLFLLILSLLAFTTFALAVTSNVAAAAANVSSPSDDDGGFSLSGSSSGFTHLYELSYYSGWLTTHVRDPRVWKRVHSCLVDADVCAVDALLRPPFLPDALYKHLNTLQVGCCKPPAVCEFNMINHKGGSWEWGNAENVTASDDCALWGNKAAVLCYDCNTCKAGLLANLRRDWSKVALLNVALLAFLLVIYALALCLFQQNGVRQRESAYKHHRTCRDLFRMLHNFLLHPFDKMYNKHISDDNIDYHHHLRDYESCGDSVAPPTISKLNCNPSPPLFVVLEL